MGKSFETIKCPKCGRTLQPAGEVTIEGRGVLPMYQCDECLMRRQVFGESLELALTFCIGADGRAFDPAEPDGVLRLK